MKNKINFQEINKQLIENMRKHEKDSQEYEYYLTELLKVNEPLLRQKASKYINQGNYEDILQEMRYATIKAAQDFDLSRGLIFSTCLMKYIDLEMLKYQSTNNTIKINKTYLYKFFEAKKELNDQGITNPTASQLAEKTGFKLSVIADLQNATSTIKSLNELEKTDEEDPRSLDYFIASDIDLSEQFSQKEIQEHLIKAINTLQKRQKTIIKLTYFDGLTQPQVAQQLKTTQPTISRVRVRAEENIKQLLSERALVAFKCKDQLIEYFKGKKIDCESLNDFLTKHSITSQNLLDIATITCFSYSEIHASRLKFANAVDFNIFNVLSTYEAIEFVKIITSSQPLKTKQVEHLKKQIKYFKSYESEMGE